MNEPMTKRRFTKKRLSLLAITVVILGGVSAWLLGFSPVRAESSQEEFKPAAILELRPSPTQLARLNLANNSDALSLYFKQQIALMGSGVVFARVLNDPELSALESLKGQNEPVAWLSKSMCISRIPDTHLIRVCCKAKDVKPDEASKLIRALVSAYSVHHNELESAQLMGEIKRQKDTIDILDRGSKNLSSRLRSLMQEAGIDEPDSRLRGEYRELLRRELLRLDLDITAEKAQQGDTADSKSDSTPSASAVKKQSLLVLKEQRKLVENEYARVAKAEWAASGLAEDIQALSLKRRKQEEQLQNLTDSLNNTQPSFHIHDLPLKSLGK